MQVEGQHDLCLHKLMATGARVRNTYPIYPWLGNSLSKERLMPDGLWLRHLGHSKDLSAMDEDASD